MKRSLGMSILVLHITAGVACADVKNYAIKEIKKNVPKNLPAATQKLFDNEAIQFLTKKGDAIAHIWFVKSINGKVKGTKANKLAYASVAPSTIIGVIEFAKSWKDYRKQTIKTGVYTLRLAAQPKDGDHEGTAPHGSFVLLLAAKLDPKSGPYEVKELFERSAASVNTTHAAVFLLFPHAKAKAKPALEARPNEHVILGVNRTITVAGKKFTLPIGLTLIGHASE